MKRKKYFYIITALFFVFYTNPIFAQIKVDGDLSDWQEECFVFDKENALHYAIQNDKENIYIAIRKDEYTGKISSSKIIGGIQLYLDKTGKRDTTNAVNIGYPIGREVTFFWDQIRLNRVDTLKKPLITSIYNEYGILAVPQYKTAGYSNLNKYQVEYKIPLEHIRPGSDKKISICILLKGMHWMTKENPPITSSPDFSTVADVKIRRGMIDDFFWSYSWIDYIVK
ncbi:hypothetical protein [Sphingobacterium paucimobilis]|uniref:Carbohydrate-binding domain-containing protein n=1 Tax=Sphingobacterium paucimobilis HER1398 TaxID=1346330 RepID=U2J5E6_9SPHI|nr:hypothetical protein [Sphingobacterium paucimobilis]ERJ60149.1 hypothetical protein M472_15405 [Sphingobacterium paucimobilis HER1398]